MSNISLSASRQFIASESMLDLSFPSQRSKSTSSACDMESPRGTPPGTPPPPYGVSSNNVEALEPGLSVDDDGPASTEVNCAIITKTKIKSCLFWKQSQHVWLSLWFVLI